MKATAIKRMVVDASMTLAWCFVDETTAYTEAVLDLLANGAEGLAPAIWPLEVANALLMGERRKRITAAHTAAMLQLIADLPIAVDPIRIDRSFGSVLALARKEGLTEYDAAYIDLALLEGVPLATLDEGLRRAAKNAGVALVKA